MSEAALDLTPALPRVATTQLKAVGLAVRRPVVVAALLLAAGKLVQGFLARSYGETLVLGYLDELGVLAGIAAFVFPILVWKGEDTFGFSTLWTLPVDHARHALVKVAAGWVWTMGLTIGFGLLMLLPVVITGGAFVEEITPLLVDPATPSGFREVDWSTPWWWWLLPFGAASATYLLGSALVLATRHPGRWIAGTVLGLLVLALLGEEGRIEWMDRLFETLLFTVGLGRYGVETLLSSGMETIQLPVDPPSGEDAIAWRELPSLTRWATAWLLWTAIGLAGLAAATWRHRERSGPVAT